MRRKTFDELVRDGEAFVRGDPPRQEPVSVRELLRDLEREFPRLVCVHCGAAKWCVDVGTLEARCLSCGGHWKLLEGAAPAPTPPEPEEDP